MLFVCGEIFEVFGIAQDINFFWSPEKAQLLVGQLVKLAILQGIISLHAYATLWVKEGQALGVVATATQVQYTHIYPLYLAAVAIGIIGLETGVRRFDHDRSLQFVYIYFTLSIVSVEVV